MAGNYITNELKSILCEHPADILVMPLNFLPGKRLSIPSMIVCLPLTLQQRTGLSPPKIPLQLLTTFKGSPM
jgi:hypothetical protein